MVQFKSSRRRRRALLALAATCVVLAVPGFASAGALDDGGVLAPVDQRAKNLTETTSTATDTVQDTIDSVLDPIEEVTKPVTDPVRDAAEPVTDAVDPVVDPVRDAVQDDVKPVTDVVDETTKPVTDSVNPGDNPARPVPDPVDTTGGGTPGARTPAADGELRRNGRTRRAAPNAAAIRRTDAPARTPAGTEGTATVPRAVKPTSAGAAPTPSRSLGEEVSRAAIDATRAFRFPLLLAAALLLFLGLQARVDSLDPRLAHGSEDEELMFA